jgi:hypothetical protein
MGKKLSEFLVVHEPMPVKPATEDKKKGRKKKISAIGQLGEGKNALSGIVDIAVMQSLNRKSEVKECVNNDQKFAVMDQKIVWYGSINLLSFGSAQESMMRIESSNIANELMKIIDSVSPR